MFRVFKQLRCSELSNNRDVQSFQKMFKKRQDCERGVAYREKLDALEVPKAPEKNLKPATV